jgi:hypothetical protein
VIAAFAKVQQLNVPDTVVWPIRIVLFKIEENLAFTVPTDGVSSVNQGQSVTESALNSPERALAHGNSGNCVLNRRHMLCGDLACRKEKKQQDTEGLAHEFSD